MKIQTTFDLALALAVGAMFLFGLAVTMVVLWPHRVLVTIAFLVLIGGLGAIRLYMALEHHRADIRIKDSQSMLLYNGDNGFVVRHGDQILSHLGQLSLPSGATVVSEETGMGVGMMPFPQTFGELMAAGFVGKDKDFILGFQADGAPIRMPKLTSLGIGGVPGSGKTVTLLSLLIQAVAKYQGRIKFLIVDPHMHVDGDESLVAKISPLAPYFLTLEDVRQTVPADDVDYLNLIKRVGQNQIQNPTEGGSELMGWMQIFEMEMHARMRGKTGDYWVIVADEFVEVMADPKTSKAISLVIEKINQQARKMNMFAILSSVEWKSSRLGGTELRDSIASFVVHNMPERLASLIVPSDIAREAQKLKQGEAILTTRGSMQIGKVPFADNEDAIQVIGLYPPDYAILEEAMTGEMKVLAPVDPQAETQPLNTRVLEIPEDFTVGELEDVRKAFLDGLTEADIAKAVYGVKSGPELSLARIKVQMILKWMVQYYAQR
jgi:hypothetical protein